MLDAIAGAQNSHADAINVNRNVFSLAAFCMESIVAKRGEKVSHEEKPAIVLLAGLVALGLSADGQRRTERLRRSS